MGRLILSCGLDLAWPSELTAMSRTEAAPVSSVSTMRVSSWGICSWRKLKVRTPVRPNLPAGLARLLGAFLKVNRLSLGRIGIDFSSGRALRSFRLERSLAHDQQKRGWPSGLPFFFRQLTSPGFH